MNVRNCRKCGKIFNYVSGPHICPKCREALEEDYQVVKKYIRENVGATISEVADECEVEVEQINQWIREERLEFAENSPIKLSCETCGASIRSGRFCDKCKAETANSMGKSIAKPKVQESIQVDHSKPNPKMRFLQ